MTSILMQAQKDPVIPFEPKVKHETMKEVTLFLERFEPGEGRGATGRWTKVREQALFCSETDKESILRTIIEFEDVSRESRLDLSTAKLKFKYFRQCLGGEVLTSWDNAKDNKPETLNNWHIANQDFIAYFFKPSDLTAQKRYLETFKKTHAITIKTFSDRLMTMNSYMRHFPGARGFIAYDALALKNLFFDAMPVTWQVDFAKAGHDINQDAYTFKQLESYMANHATLANVLFENNKIKDGRGGRFGNQPRGRDQGRGRGGRFSGHRRFHDSNDKQDNKRKKETCHVHVGSAHTWYDCSQNPKSSNYRPQNNQSDDGNRGGGRGRWNNNNGGRGNGGGRGGGRGRGNYNNNRGNQNTNPSDTFQQDQNNNNQGNNQRNNQGNNGNNNQGNNGNTNRNNNNNSATNNQDNHWMDNIQW
jgi:hypothetical protein